MDTAVRVAGPRPAHRRAYLRADVWVSANDCAGLERLCRYLLRPPARLIGAEKAGFPAARGLRESRSSRCSRRPIQGSEVTHGDPGREEW